jgi:hypothetical protein
MWWGDRAPLPLSFYMNLNIHIHNILIIYIIYQFVKKDYLENLIGSALNLINI